MASGTVGGGDGEKEGSKEKQRWAEESKVYTRKSFKGLKNSNKNSNSYGTQLGQPQTGKLGDEDVNLLQEPAFGVASGDSSSQNRPLGNRDVSAGNGVGKGGFLRQESRVTINLAMKSKREARELRRRLESELNEIRNLVKKIEGKEGKKTSKAGRGVDNAGKLKRVHSEVGSVGTPRVSKPLHQLNVSVVENSQDVSDNTEKEKRTPKANKFYKNTEFFLAKDKFPPAESNKKSKSNAGKKGGGNESGQGFESGKFSNQMLKTCSSLLDRLIKHKHGWVFNKPVDTVALGLHDYFDIIKNPMDLGTVKSRLNKNWYKSPKEFAEDVRLTFQNAMTYNPKGQDVYVMAEELSNVFEEKWAVIEADYMHELMHGRNYEVGLPTPKSKKALSAVMAPPEMRTVDMSEPMTNPVDPKTKTTSSAPSLRTASRKKPKAKDPNKREMTYDEKQKLSTNLQSLPSEKLEHVVQIIRKRNSSLCQNDDEIEVDIDSVDTETLWELDRFVTNYKKSLSKNKRKAELANQEKGESVQNVQEKSLAPAATGTPKESKKEGKNIFNISSHAEVEKKRDNASRSSNSSGSNCDSGSSSGDSDSGSSSDNGSDA